MEPRKKTRREIPAFPGRVISARQLENDGVPRLRSHNAHSCEEHHVKSKQYSHKSKTVESCRPTKPNPLLGSQRHNVEYSSTNDSISPLPVYEPQPDPSTQQNASGGVMHNVKQKLSDNVGNYSNLFQGMAYLLRLSSRGKKSSRSRSGSRNRNSSKTDSSNNAVIINEREIIGDNFVNVENIELYQMDGFVFSSEKEKGKGHNFVPLQLKAPTWCDKCGDFIWGVYKQCLQCSNNENVHSKCFVNPDESRPKSFLHDEMDEFDRVFSELFFSPHKRMSQITADLVLDDQIGHGSTLRTTKLPLHSISEKEDSVTQNGAQAGSSSTGIQSFRKTDSQGSSSNRTGESKEGTVTAQSGPSKMLSSETSRISGEKAPLNKVKRSSLHEDMLHSYETDSKSVQEARFDLYKSSLKKLKSSLWDKNDKLFADLLDDLDSISKLDTESARKRKKARDLFSDWLFSYDVSPCDKTLSQNQPSESRYLERTPSGSRLRTPKSRSATKAKRRSTDLSDLSTVWSEMVVNDAPFQHQHEKSSNSSVWLFKRSPSRRRFLFAKVQELFKGWRPAPSSVICEDDADSGYHTGEYSVGKQGLRLSGQQFKPPGHFTLTREDLRRSIEAFNNNNYGLIVSLQQDSLTFQGFIRVHMNLIRPISMSLSVRPPSIYDVLTHDEPEPCTRGPDSEIASFYLPKDTTKVIHIASDTTTQEVIRTLLSKFKITDNPRKFALYEKAEEKKKVIMRRMSDDEQPLPLCLSWGAEGLHTNRFVLQENDPGEIIWDAFSVPELDNFLRILNKEEEEYVDQIRAKYQLMEIHIHKKLEEMEAARQKRHVEKAKACLGSAIQHNMSKQLVNSQDNRTPPHLNKLDMRKTLESPTAGSGVSELNSYKEKSPPADQIDKDEREPVFV